MRLRYSLYNHFVIIILLFFVLVVAASIWSLSQWRQTAERQFASTLQNELSRVDSIFQGEIEKFDILAQVVRSKQFQLAILTQHDNYASIGIVLKNLATYFDLDLLLYHTEQGVMASSSPAWKRKTDLDLGPGLFLGQLSEKARLLAIPGSRELFGSDDPAAPMFGYTSRVPVRGRNGETLGHVLIFKLLNGHESMKRLFDHKTPAEVILATAEGRVIMTTLEGGWRWLDMVQNQFRIGDKLYLSEDKPYYDLNGKELFRLIVAMDQTSLQLMVGQLLLVDLPVYLGLIIVTVYLGWFMKRRVFAPITAQVAALRRVSQGDLKTRLELPKAIPRSGHNEITRMADDFNTMMDRLEDSYEELEKKSEQLMRAKQVAEEAAKAKSHFLATMSHEIRTPMNGVLGMLYLLNKTQLDARQRRYVKTATGSGELLLTVINDILDFSKLESGKIKPESIEFDLTALLEHSMTLLAKGAYDKGLEFDYLTEQQTPRWVKGDPIRLLQVLTNLLSNAIKFTEQGKILLKVSAVDEHSLHFAVCDTGIGLSGAQQKNLFKAFTQMDGSHTRKYGGTGLGLAISQKLVTAMGGEIKVNSEPGVGSEFSFDLPLERVSGEIYKLNVANRLSQKRILVVDDEFALRTMLQIILQKWHVTQIGLAEDGRMALQQLRAAAEAGEPYDIVILDMKMPEMTGLELARAIRADTTLDGVLLLMLSAIAQDNLNPELDAWLSKPVQRNELYTALLSLLDDQAANTVANNAGTEDHQDWHFAGKRLLLAEDNEVNQEVVKEILEETGIDIDTCENGAEAVQAVKQQHYDIVLMDIQMPVMDGLEATREIRGLGGHYTELPIIAMTAHALAGDSEKSLAAGMNAHIVKPIEPEQVYQTIAAWLKPRQQDDPEDKESNSDQEQENTMDEFPQLPGIDTVEGLARFRGKQASYRRLLLQFRNKQANVADELEDLIEQDKWEDAALLAHSIKGNSGNLSAKRLYDASSDLEQACRQIDHEVAKSKLAVFRTHLNEVIEGLALLEQGGNSSAPMFDPAAVNTLLKRLEYLLDSDLNKALDCLAKLQQQAAGSHIADTVMKLEAALNTRDIDRAKAIARHMRVA